MPARAAAALEDGAFREALENARKSAFADAEWQEYERSKMAEQDERGRISLAHRQGELRASASWSRRNG